MIRAATTGALLFLLAATALAEPPDRVDPADYPDAGAVILRWRQRFTLEADGTVRTREAKWVQILRPQAIRGLADPRIDYREGEDEVVVHAARTHLPDGTVLPVPGYSYNVAAPDDVAGWPEWAAWRQKIVSFSGLRPGAVIEYDHEVITKAGVLPWLSAEVRLDAEHPVLFHEVVLDVPWATRVNLSDGHESPEAPPEGRDVYVWRATHLPADRHEPQAPSWRERCPVATFTTCGDHPDWVRGFTGPVDAAAVADDAIRAFAEKAAKGAEGDEARVEAVIRRLRDTTQLVDSPKTWRSRRCRRAAEVFRSAYGGPLGYAALATAAVRALGYETGLAVATIPTSRWNALLSPADSAFASLVLLVKAPGGELVVHPRDGVFTKEHGFGGHTLLEVGPDGPVKVGRIWELASRGDGLVNELGVEGKLALNAKGALSGTLTLRAGPRFFDPAKLDSAGAQKSFCEGVLRRLLPGIDVRSFAVRRLSPDALEVVVSVGRGPLEAAGGLRVLELGPMALADVPIPLDPGERETPVELAAAFRESVDLRIELPEKAVVAAAPVAVSVTEESWGRIEQETAVEGRELRIRRVIEIGRDRLEPAEHAAVRAALNALRSPAGRTIAVAPE